MTNQCGILTRKAESISKLLVDTGQSLDQLVTTGKSSYRNKVLDGLRKLEPDLIQIREQYEKVVTELVTAWLAKSYQGD